MNAVKERFRKQASAKLADTAPVQSLKPKADDETPIPAPKKKVQDLTINIPPPKLQAAGDNTNFTSVAATISSATAKTPVHRTLNSNHGGASTNRDANTYRSVKPIVDDQSATTPRPKPWCSARSKSMASEQPLFMKKAQSHMVNNQQRGQSDRTPTGLNVPKQEASQQYAEYLQRMQKEIHDEKMKRFVEHTQKLNEAIPEKSPQRQRSISKRVDTGLRKENQQVDLEYRVSISPERKRSTSKGF